MKKQTLAYCALLFSCAIWGASFYIIKDTVASIHAIPLVSYRFLFAGLLLFPWVFPHRSELKRAAAPGLMLGGTLWGICILQNWGLHFTSASNSAFITGLFILFIPFLQRFLGGPWIDGRQLISIVLACIGLWFITGGINGFNRGDLMTLACAFFCAIHVLLADRFSKAQLMALHLAFVQFMVVGVLSLGLSLFMGLSFSVTNQAAYGAIGFLILFPSLIAFFLQLRAQRYLSPLHASLILSIEPVFAAAFAWTLGGEEMTFKVIIGGSLILTGVFTHQFIQAKEKNSGYLSS